MIGKTVFVDLLSNSGVSGIINNNMAIRVLYEFAQEACLILNQFQIIECHSDNIHTFLRLFIQWQVT